MFHLHIARYRLHAARALQGLQHVAVALGLTRRSKGVHVSLAFRCGNEDMHGKSQFGDGKSPKVLNISQIWLICNN